MILAPPPRERERWYAMLLLAQGWTAAGAAEALERDPHTIGRWASAFGEGGPAALDIRADGWFPPPLDPAHQEELKAAVQLPPSLSGYGMMANWYWKVVRRFASERFGVRPVPQQLSELSAPLGIRLQASQEAVGQGQ